jgi:thiamine-phosphate pyrophosphorylase
MQGVYPIIDVDALETAGLPVLGFAEAVLTTAPPIIQLRAKHASPRHTLELLRGLRPLCSRQGTLLFANDRPDLARLAGCDGVHLGQDDLPLNELRQLKWPLRVGLSTHDPEQLRAALALRPDYVAYGPIFPTGSKANPDPVVGLAGLSEAVAAAKHAGIPLVAIGGLSLDRARSVAAIGAVPAVISALIPASGGLAAVVESAHALRQAVLAGFTEGT